MVFFDCLIANNRSFPISGCIHANSIVYNMIFSTQTNQLGVRSMLIKQDYKMSEYMADSANGLVPVAIIKTTRDIDAVIATFGFFGRKDKPVEYLHSLGGYVLGNGYASILGIFKRYPETEMVLVQKNTTMQYDGAVMSTAEIAEYLRDRTTAQASRNWKLWWARKLNEFLNALQK